MAKLNVRAELPIRTPNAVIKTAEDVYRQHISMGANSPLQSFDMVQFNEKLTNAKAHLEESKHLHAEGEVNTQDAYALIGIFRGQTVKTKGTLYNMLVLIRNQLLVAHHDEEEQISQYGFNVVVSRNRVRIDLQRRKPDAMLYLCERIYERHVKLGNESPLKALDMASFNIKCITAKEFLEHARKFHESGEANMQRAKKLLGIEKSQNSRTKGTIYYLLSLIRRQLLLTYHGNEEKLSTFGFNVVIRLSKKRKKKKQANGN